MPVCCDMKMACVQVSYVDHVHFGARIYEYNMELSDDVCLPVCGDYIRTKKQSNPHKTVACGQIFAHQGFLSNL